MTSIWAVGAGVGGIRPAALACDTGLMLGCLLAVAVVVERWGRVRFQFGLATLATVVAAIAVVLALWPWLVVPGPWNSTPRWFLVSQGTGAYRRMDLRWWSEIVPMLFGIACGLHLAVQLTLRAAYHLLARLRRAGAARVEAADRPTRTKAP